MMSHINPYLYQVRKNIWKNSVSLFFIFTFLFLRIVDVHAFSHLADDDKVHCDVCEIITVSHKISYFPGIAFVELEQKTIIGFPVYKINFCYETVQYSTTLPESIYNKPPPLFFI